MSIGTEIFTQIENNFEFFNPYSNKNELLKNAQLKNQAIYSSHQFFINSKNFT